MFMRFRGGGIGHRELYGYTSLFEKEAGLDKQELPLYDANGEEVVGTPGGGSDMDEDEDNLDLTAVQQEGDSDSDSESSDGESESEEESEEEYSTEDDDADGYNEDGEPLGQGEYLPHGEL
jgi:hypothetical protein